MTLQSTQKVVVVKSSELTINPSKVETMNVPNHNSMFDSKKMLQIDFEDGKKTARVPFDAPLHKKFNPDTMFHPVWESSNFYDLFLNSPYVEMTFFGQDNTLGDAVAEYEQIGKKGYFAKLLGSKHRVLFGDWDEHGSALLVPVDARIKTLKDLGLTITIRSKADKPKVRKYMRRIHAHHEWSIPGTSVGGYAVPQGQVTQIQTRNTCFDVLHVDIDKLEPKNLALADGIHLVDVNLLHELGREFGIKALEQMEAGDAFKGTELDGIGLGKGFFHVVRMETYGIIIYGPKKQVSFDKFFFGSLGEVKGGDARTCMQSIGAFITEESRELWVNQMILFVSQLMDSLHDEKKIKHMFLTTVGSMAEMLENNDRESWVLVEAIRHGVPILRNPGLFRRVVRYLMNRVLDCERGRIPYGPVAHRYNVMPELNCFDFETGGVDYRKSVIPENAVVCMDANQGPFAMYRQPLGNAKEAVVTTNIHNRRFRRFIGRERVILGVSALEQLAIMGGGDMDDAVIGTDNLAWIEVISKADYPVTVLPEADAKALNTDLDEDNHYLNGGSVKIGDQTIRLNPTVRQYPTTWSMVDYFEAGAEAFNPQLSIGPVDNAVRLDLMLSGVHKEHMLHNLAARVEKATGNEKAKLIRAYHWLEDREDFQLREVGSNLESFIDFVKMRKGDESVIGMLTQKINDLSSQSAVFPECWNWLGRGGRGRIPLSRKEQDDFVLAPSLVCETLNTIRLEHAKLMEALKEEEWTMVQKPPMQLDMEYPRDRGTMDEARELRILWREWWMPFIANETVTESDKAYGLILRGGAVILKDGTGLELEGINPKFNQWKPAPDEDAAFDLRMPLAVEIARQTYRNRFNQAERGEDGRRRGFSDGLLWSNTIGLMYIQALKYAGLTGLYLPVRFDRYSSNLRTGIIEIKMIAGIVFRKSDNFTIGHVISDDIPADGEYTMEDGIVTVTEPAPELIDSVTDVDEEYNNPVTDELEIMA